jgi:hypothetical protein
MPAAAVCRLALRQRNAQVAANASCGRDGADDPDRGKHMPAPAPVECWIVAEAVVGRESSGMSKALVST